MAFSPTTWDWARRCRCWRCCAPIARPRRPPGSPSLVVVPRSLLYNWIEEAARFTPSLKVVEYGGPGARRYDAKLGKTRCRRHHLWHLAAGYRLPRHRRVRHRRPRRSAGDQEPRVAGRQGQPLAHRTPPSGPHRHTDREPPRRAGLDLRVPQPRPSRTTAVARSVDGRPQSPASRSWRVWPKVSARSFSVVPRRRCCQTCHRRPSRSSTPRSTIASASSTTSYEPAIRRACCSEWRRRESRARHRGTRGAAATAPDRLSPGLVNEDWEEAGSAKLETLFELVTRYSTRATRSSSSRSSPSSWPTSGAPRRARR